MMHEYMLLNNFVISIVGRTNVGKSTIFNRLTRSRDAIVYNQSSVTRDIKSGYVNFFGKNAILQDTPGIYDEIDIDDPSLRNKVCDNIERAISASDLIIFTIDAVSGIIDYDYRIAKLLRKYNKVVAVVCNKCESAEVANSVSAECFGFKDVFYISAEHNIGVMDLELFLSSMIPERSFVTVQHSDTKITIIGKQNVGKSTMINLILGEDKQLVADYAGLTRDVAQYNCNFCGHDICIVDTPGIRRKKANHDDLSTISAIISKNSIHYTDVVILIIDAATLEHGDIDRIDYALANDVIKAGKPIVIAFNKLDKTPYRHNERPKFLQKLFAKNLHQLKLVPFLFVSAANNINIQKMIEMAIDVNRKQYTRISTKKLNDWLQEISRYDYIQSFGAMFKMKYITQTGTKPLQFIVFVRNKKNMRKDHERFITNRFRHAFDIHDIPIRFVFREV